MASHSNHHDLPNYVYLLAFLLINGLVMYLGDVPTFLISVLVTGGIFMKYFNEKSQHSH